MDVMEYRSRARRCLVQARLVSNPGVRAGLIDMATQWMLCAERAERQSPVVQQQRQKPVVQQQQQVQPKQKPPA
jgi:hypothetical protein